MKRFALVSVIILLTILAVIAGWGYRSLHRAKAHDAAGEYITVPRGTPPAQVIRRLAGRGIIADELPVLAYLRLTGAGTRLKAGEYRFPSPITPLDVLNRLEEGQQRLNRFTVIEGWTRWDIAEAMTRLPSLNLQTQEQALKLMDNVDLISDLDPLATNLEGYLYPDTYSFPPDTTPQQIIEIMVRRFRDVWQEHAASSAGRTPREAVTVASLIETEAKIPGERPLVASVIYNRLQRGMSLGIDSSVIYASKLAGKWRDDGKVYRSDLDRESPYNMRRVAGLPPGPIASPSESSIVAALRPASTDFLYYVRDPARDDGTHNFYNNEAGFFQGVQALRQWERDALSGAAR